MNALETMARLQARVEELTARILKWQSFAVKTAIDLRETRWSLKQSQAENARLKRGEFTPDELQELCHHLPETDKRAFFKGCADYQRKLFGEADIDKARATCGE